jgi:hypothetical protein
MDMELIFSLLPIAVILLACGGMHFLMMRGMHSGHGANQVGHHGSATDGTDGRVAQLESQVSRLEDELAASQPGALRVVNGNRRDPVASSPRNVTSDSDSGRRCH